MKDDKKIIKGHLEIIAVDNEVFIHGNKEGLLSLSDLLIKIGNFDQEQCKDLPIGAKDHIHLSPNIQLSQNSSFTVIGRLDAKGTGKFHQNYIPRD
ncbi:MAG: hypothetical protein JXB88_24075 [Spirochaetales bacterium]|nr:hypothetical protein [Spirochaetales bacterium]